MSSDFTALEKSVTALEAKYALSYNEIENNIVDAQKELSGLIGQLTGDEFAVKGLLDLQNRLKD